MSKSNSSVSREVWLQYLYRPSGNPNEPWMSIIVNTHAPVRIEPFN